MANDMMAPSSSSAVSKGGAAEKGGKAVVGAGGARPGEKKIGGGGGDKGKEVIETGPASKKKRGPGELQQTKGAAVKVSRSRGVSWKGGREERVGSERAWNDSS